MANPFDQFDAPAPDAKVEANPFDQFDGKSASPTATSANPFDQFDPQRYAHLASDSSFDPASSVAQGVVDPETGFQVQKLRDARPLTEKIGAGLASLVNPQTYVNAAKGVMNFVTGAGQAIGIDPFVHAYYSATGDPRALTKQAEATIEGQNAEESAKRTGAAILNLKPNIGAFDVSGSMDTAMPSEDPAEEARADAAANEARARNEFSQKVQAAKNAQQLAKGHPLDTGAIASIYNSAGQIPSQEVGPEALQEAGAPAVDPAAIERASAIADPMNIALGVAPELPGAQYLGGKIAQGVGKSLQIPGQIASAIPGRIGRIAGGGAGAAIGAVEGAIHSPATAAAIASGVGASRGLQWLGKGIEQQGAAAASGIPSALDTVAANARLTGQSAIGTNAQRVAGDAVARAASTAVGMAPVNLAIANGDPEQFAQSEVGAAAFGGASDLLHSSRPALVEAARPALRQKGIEAQDLNTPEGRASAQYLQTLPEAQRNTALELNGTFAGMPVENAQGQPVPARMIVQTDAQYQAQWKKLGVGNAPQGGGRGFFWDGNGTAYINGENSSFSNPEQAAQTMGHEFAGHAAMNMLEAAGAKGGPIYDGLINTAKSELYNTDGTPTPEFQKFIDGYNKASDPTGQTKAIDPANPNSVEEFIAETAGRIISQRGTAEIALPKNILDRVTDGVGRFMSAFTGVDPNTVGTGGRFDRTEVAKLSGVVRDTLMQLAGMKLRPAEGEGPIARPQTPEEYVQELQETLAKPRPTDTADNVKSWLKEQAQARKDLADFQSGQPNFPAGGKAPVAPSAPAAPPNPARENAIKAMVVMGIKPVEAAQFVDAAANALGGTPNASDLLTAATKLRGGGKLQPTNVQPIPSPQGQPVSESAVVATEGTQPVATATSPIQHSEAPAVAGGTPEPVTPESVAKLVSAAEETATAAEKNPRTKAAQDRIRTAKINAIMDAIGDDETGLHRVTDQFGNSTISGTFNPENPYHKALADIGGGISKPVAAKFDQFQQAQGTPIYIRYRSAKSDTAGAGGEGTAKGVGDMGVRQQEYEADPAQSRTEGQPQHKVVIPMGAEVKSPSGSLIGHFLTLDNLLHNAASIFEGMKKANIPNPYGDLPADQERQLVADAQAYAKNHANGYPGDGAGPIQQFPDTGLPPVNPDYVPTTIPKERFDVLNMMMHNETARKLAALSARVQADQAAGKDTPKSILASFHRAQEAYALAEENSRWIDHSSGETNQLRQQLKASGFDTQKSLKSPFETLLPKHILDISDKPIPLQDGDIPSARPTGFDIDPIELAREGMPNQKAVAAGFLPDTTQKEEFQDDASSQVGFLNDEARGRGFSNVNEMGAEDPSALTKISALWRRFHAREKDGSFLQIKRVNAINSELYGDQKPDPETAETRDRLAGSREAIGDALAFVSGGARTSGEGASGVGADKAEALRQKEALKQWALKNGMAIDSLPSKFDARSDDNEGLGEHDAWHDQENGRWIKSTNRSGEFMGQYPSVDENGNIKIEEGSPAQYLQRLSDQNRLFGDDIRIHAVVVDGNTVKIITSQPDVSGNEVSQPEIDSSMAEAGFDTFGNGRYYRKRDNTAVFDLNPSNAVKNGGVLVPYDAIVVHPSGDLKDAVEDALFSNRAKAARAAFVPDSEEGETPSAASLSPNTLYRASDDPIAKTGAYFSENEEDARSYQNNPGFGGKNLNAYGVNTARTANVPDLKSLAKKLGPLLSNDQNEWVESRGGLESAMREMGFTTVFHALENSFGPKRDRIDPSELLSKDHDWIRFDDDFPEGSKTMKYIGGDNIPPNSKAVFSPDNGLPEEGETPQERLTREAEAAGVVLKTDDLKNLIRMDPATVERIRRRIEQQTGSPARFVPDESSTPQRPIYVNSRKTIPLASILAQQRKSQRESVGVN